MNWTAKCRRCGGTIEGIGPQQPGAGEEFEHAPGQCHGRGDLFLRNIPPPPLTRAMLAEELADIRAMQTQLAGALLQVATAVQSISKNAVRSAELVERLAQAAERQTEILVRALTR